MNERRLAVLRARRLRSLVAKRMRFQESQTWSSWTVYSSALLNAQIAACGRLAERTALHWLRARLSVSLKHAGEGCPIS